MERWNTHFSKLIELTLFELELKLFQDPNSNDLGTTVWDASIVCAKYLEKNASRGNFSREKVRKMRVIELGSGVGLGGISMALLGCQDVTLTDKKDLLPLIQNNIDANLSKSALIGTSVEGKIGKIKICELDWTAKDKLVNVDPPYDMVLATDCIYHENHMEYLLDTILQITNHRSSILLVNELRSLSVDEEFKERFGKHFIIKKVPNSTMDPHFQHSDIHILLLKRRKATTTTTACSHSDTNIISFD